MIIVLIELSLRIINIETLDILRRFLYINILFTKLSLTPVMKTVFFLWHNLYSFLLQKTKQLGHPPKIKEPQISNKTVNNDDAVTLIFYLIFNILIPHHRLFELTCSQQTSACGFVVIILFNCCLVSFFLLSTPHKLYCSKMHFIVLLY